MKELTYLGCDIVVDGSEVRIDMCDLDVPTSEQRDELAKKIYQYLEDEGILEEHETEMNLADCEQCGEPAWDGRICHTCGMKHV
jgi:hypothetical protein